MNELIISIEPKTKRPVYIQSMLICEPRKGAIDDMFAEVDIYGIKKAIDEAESQGQEVVGILLIAPESISHIYGLPVFNHYKDNKWGIRPY